MFAFLPEMSNSGKMCRTCAKDGERAHESHKMRARVGMDITSGVMAPFEMSTKFLSFRS